MTLSTEHDIPNDTPSGPLKIIEFHTRNAMTVFLALLGILVIFFILLGVQYHKSSAISRQSLINHFDEQVVYLDSLLQQMISHLNDMHETAVTDLLETRLQPGMPRHPTFNLITDAPALYFHMDKIEAPFTREMMGNLTGDGNLSGRNRDFYREIHMALRLNPLFRSARQSVKTSAWVYYISASGFINLYPWVASEEWRFTTESYEKEFYSRALPENNSSKELFWTRVYTDEVGMGLMSTCAVPIYDENRFVGVLAMDVTVDFLNRIVSRFRSGEGSMFLMNDQEQLLAHPNLTSSKDRQIKNLEDALPGSLRQQHQSLDDLLPGEPLRTGDFLVLKGELQRAPWTLFYIEKQPSLIQAFINHFGVTILLLLAGLLGLVIAVIILNHFFFILPAEKLVQFILVRNRWERSDLDQHVPGIWKPLFAVVDHTYAKVESFTRESKNQSKLLEDKVRQRTADLEHVNTTLQQQIKERRKVESELQQQMAFTDTALNSQQDTFFLFNPVSSQAVRWNKAFNDISGYSDEEIAVLPAPETYYSPEDLERARQFIQEVVQEGIGIIELELICKDGQKIPMEYSVSLIDDDRNNLKYMISIGRDISERRQAAVEKEILEAKLQQSLKMEAVGTLAGGIAHDFNNILGIIIGNTDLAISIHDSTGKAVELSKARSNLEEIKVAGLRAKDLVHQLLSFSRKSAALKRPIDIGPVVNESMRLLRASIPTTIDIEVKIEELLEPVNADPTQIQQVIINLCNNAAHAMEKTGGKLFVGLEQVTLDNESRLGYFPLESGRYVRLTVRDTGMGIPREIRRRVFDPYFTTKEVGKGSGMGLAIVHGIVTHHDGAISISSEPGDGTQVHVLLPVTAGQLSADPVNTKDIPGGTESILFVDDEVAIASVTGQLIERLGYRVRISTDPEEALRVFTKDPDSYDLVITDMTMPKMTGVKLASAMFSIRKDIPVIISTGYSSLISETDAEHLGLAGLVMKPIDIRETAGLIRSVLDK
ncbi:MAG: response regulator [Desulfobacteraceae bacterium]|nr:MAG: response regulator [Desulfobacteraceae bacterium]